MVKAKVPLNAYQGLQKWAHFSWKVKASTRTMEFDYKFVQCRIIVIIPKIFVYLIE